MNHDVSGRWISNESRVGDWSGWRCINFWDENKSHHSVMASHWGIDTLRWIFFFTLKISRGDWGLGNARRLS